ncbi:MAG: cytochrome C [bacterium]
MAKKALLGVNLIVVGVVGFAIYVGATWNKQWDVPMPTLKASTDPAIIAKGEYLVRGPAHCSNCHVASFDEMKRSDAGERLPLRGGVVFALGPIGELSPSNLTPDVETGIGRYSDGQLFRMLRHAIKPDGTSTLSGLMPFWKMADEDHVAIVSYLRSQKPVRNVVPGPDYFILGKILRTFISAFEPILHPTVAAFAPPTAPTVERGRYLANNVADCFGCHTKHDRESAKQVGPDFGGGSELEPMPFPDVDQTIWFRTPNLTPHPTGYLKRVGTVENWVARMRAGRVYAGSPMPWGPFSRMKEADLIALWKYLNSVEPVEYMKGATTFKKES